MPTWLALVVFAICFTSACFALIFAVHGVWESFRKPRPLDESSVEFGMRPCGGQVEHVHPVRRGH